jgi:hypothetical protein
MEHTIKCKFTGTEHTFNLAAGAGAVPDTPEGWLNVNGHVIAPGPEVKLVVGDKEVVLRKGIEKEVEEDPKPKRGRKGS